MENLYILLGYSVFPQNVKMAMNFTPQVSFFPILGLLIILNLSGLGSMHSMCTVKVNLDFVVSSVAVVFVSTYLKVMRLNSCFSKNIISFFPKVCLFGVFFNGCTCLLTSEN